LKNPSIGKKKKKNIGKTRKEKMVWVFRSRNRESSKGEGGGKGEKGVGSWVGLVNEDRTGVRTCERH